MYYNIDSSKRCFYNYVFPLNLTLKLGRYIPGLTAYWPNDVNDPFHSTYRPRHSTDRGSSRPNSRRHDTGDWFTSWRTASLISY